jgi:hypothetical protein
MTKALTVAKFDYSQVSKEDGGKLIYYAAEIQKQGKTHVESGMEMGRVLTEARGILGDGKAFAEWVECECGCSFRTAYNYMTAYENFGGFANFAKLELSAMYRLAKNPEAKKAAEKLANKGIKITHSLAKELVEKSTVQQPESEPPAPAAPAATASHGPGAAPEPVSPDPLDTKEPPPAPVCPNCGASDYDADEDGLYCRACKEPAQEQMSKRAVTQRQKTIKTVEALMRAFDDLQDLRPGNRHQESIDGCKALLRIAREWK